MFKVVSQWTGFQGAPGYTNLYFVGGSPFSSDPIEAQGAVDRVHTFFGDLGLALPSTVTIQVNGEVEVIDPSDGTLLDIVNVTAPSAVNGVATGAYSAPSGACINWHTSNINRGRRVRGRTYIVPLANSQYEDDGTLLAGARSTILNAGTALLEGAIPFVIWSRPSSSGATDGISAPVDTVRVTDAVAVLRSRRD